jgi:trans-aconitate methyltransferase
MNTKEHWERTYETTEPAKAAWHQPQPETSLRLITSAGVERDGRIIDVGGGDSLLVDELLNRGFTDVTVLDISGTALTRARSRLGDRAQPVTWMSADVIRLAPAHGFDLWHDRALFHFLTRPSDQVKYIQVLKSALPPGGHVVMATFALDGPAKCSGLEVARYSADSLTHVLGEGFKLEETVNETHITPSGQEQRYLYCRFSRSA